MSSPIPLIVAKQVHRLGLSKSMWTRLLPPAKAWLRAKMMLSPEEGLPGEADVYDVHPVWEQLARSLTYREEWRRQHPCADHGNIGEVRAYLREESRIAAGHVSARVAYALDSQVALGTVVKGRASSKALDAELMKSVPVVMGSDMYSAFGYWPSKLNRVDGPTRHAPRAEHDEPSPWWWDEFCSGDLVRFDEWLHQLEHDVSASQPLPHLRCRGDAVDLRTGRQESWDRFRIHGRLLLRAKGA